MTEPLRPMSTGQLLDRTFALYRKNFPLFVGIAVVTHAIYLAYELLTIRSAPGIRAVRFGASYYANLSLSWAFMTVVLTVSQAATVKAVAAVHLDQSTSVWASYGNLRGRIFSVFGVLFFVFLIAGLITGLMAFITIFTVGLIMVATGSAGGPKSVTANLIIGFTFLALVFGIFVTVYARYALAVQACVVENLRAWASMKRSVVLSKDGRLRIAAVYLVLMILSWILAFFMGWLAGLAGRPFHSRIATMVLVDVAGFISGSITAPLVTIGISLLYYDERVRKEAFDLQVMFARLDTSPPTTASPAVV